MGKEIKVSLFVSMFGLTLGLLIIPAATYAQTPGASVEPSPSSISGQQQTQTPEDLGPGGSAPGAASSVAKKPSQTFKALAGVPGITNLENLTMAGFLNAIYRMLIVIGAMIAVLKITIAGLKYMGSDNFGNKASAKEDITTALLGLLILLATVLIINTVMGGVNLNALQQAPQINYPQQPPPSIVPPTLQPGTIAMDHANGCKQVASGTCGSGNVAILKGSSVGCAPSTAVSTVPGQSTFNYMTETQCTLATARHGVNDKGNITGLIVSGKNIYGLLEVKSNETQPTVESLLADCKTAGGSQVIKTETTYASSIFVRGVYGYVCTN